MMKTKPFILSLFYVVLYCVQPFLVSSRNVVGRRALSPLLFVQKFIIFDSSL